MHKKLQNFKSLVKRGVLHARVNFPNLKIKLDSKEPVSSLKELNKIIHSLKAIEFNREYFDNEEDPLFFRLGFINENIRHNEECMEFLKSASDVEEGYKHKKIALENTKIIDLHTNRYSASLDVPKLRTKISDFCEGVENSNYALLHITGKLSDEEKRSLTDAMKSKLTKTDVRILSTPKEVLGKTIVEGYFFGPFEEEFI